MTKFSVIGAGMAGLLAGCILRDECSQITEAQSDIPNNHSALLRFRSSVVGDALNIPFKPVQVMKAVVPFAGNPVGDALAYSMKVTGRATLRSIAGAEGKLEQRFIAPQDLIARMWAKVSAPIRFGTEWTAQTAQARKREWAISTLPMPLLAKLLNYDQELPEFRWSPGWVARVTLRNVDAYATVYIPDPKKLAYRASITGDQLIVEYAFPGCTPEEAGEKMAHLTDYPLNLRDHLADILEYFGLNFSLMVGKPELKPQRFAKILPIDDTARKRFILWATEEHNVFCFGRFATWRPGLLLDDLVNDLRVIQRIAAGTTYEGRK